MKTTICVVCLLCATAAVGQSILAAAPNASSFQITDHPTRAISQPMSLEQNLLGTTPFTSAHGEMPLWEAPLQSHEVPLGDTARALRKEHATAKKARLVLEK
jgi:hypothetical protein